MCAFSPRRFATSRTCRTVSIGQTEPPEKLVVCSTEISAERDAVPRLDRAGGDARDGGRARRLGVVDVGGRVDHDLVAGARLRQDRDEVAHGPGRHQHAVLHAEKLGHAAAELVGGRVRTRLFVAHDGVRHRSPHAVGRSGLGVGKKVDDVCHAASVARPAAADNRPAVPVGRGSTLRQALGRH
jgi:hypothetical protein